MRNVANDVCLKVSYFVHHKPRHLLKQIHNPESIRFSMQLWFEIRNNLKL